MSCFPKVVSNTSSHSGYGSHGVSDATLKFRTGASPSDVIYRARIFGRLRFCDKHISFNSFRNSSY